ncbi:MAG: DNA repair protein RecN [Alphaproteobacteria bacterium]|nr:DNA repair protein RecN [Alphaproteobacteria bacterium]
MLANLSIKNIVLIDQLSIPFESGFSALTGETGAGKSILLDSLGLALGARSDSGLVRRGEDKASVTATFDLSPDHPVFNYLQEQEIDVDGSELIVRRTLTKDGRSKAYINDEPVSAALLKRVGALLVEIHGQFDTHQLLDSKYHRGLLDEYGVPQEKQGALSKAWDTWHERLIAFEEKRAAMEKAREDEEYFRSALEDLDRLSPEEGEEEKLSSLRERLMKREQFLDGLNNASSGIAEIESLMGNVWRALEPIGNEASSIQSAVDSANAELQEASHQISSILSDLENNEYSLTEIDDRLFALKNQARKHDCSVDELSMKRDEIADLLSAIEDQDDTLHALEKEVSQVRESYKKIAEEVRQLRQKAAKEVAGLVMQELAPLKLDKARFVVGVEPKEESAWNANGMDSVQFLIATNPGTEPGPLNKVTSGGEMARFMLALKVVLAEVGAAGTLVFDEVDTGIGGATASAVGERLSRLASKCQILVVTHSPQVAAMASHHLIVSKGGNEGAFKTSIDRLSEHEKRQEEIARMLSGAEITVEARAAAGKLIEAGKKPQNQKSAA